MKPKKVKGNVRNELTRVDFARGYLTELGLNSKCDQPTFDYTGAEQKRSPFQFAARELYSTLLRIKRIPRLYSSRDSRWIKNLILLGEPMTKRNFKQWWKVARVLLNEEWEINQQIFRPLVEHLKIKPCYPSEIMTRVIDQSLHDAFETLARDPNL